MLQAVEYRFGAGETPPTPIEWLTDNGSCYTAHATRQFAGQLNLKPVTTHARTILKDAGRRSQ